MTSPTSMDLLFADARTRAGGGAWREVCTLLGPREAELAADSEMVVLYGEALMRTGEERRARDWLRAAEPRLVQNDERAAHRRAVNMLGAACLALGELEAAAQSFGRALELATQADDLLVLARATNNLGAIANLQGDRERALWHYRLAVPTFQRLGQQRGLAASFHNMAITFRDQGQLDEADEHERRAIEYATDGDVPRLAAMGRVGRAEIALRRGDARLAEATARIATEEFARLGDLLNEGDAWRLTGASCAAQQRHDEAFAAFDRALAIAGEHGHALTEAETLRDRMEVRVRTGARDLARDDAAAALAIFVMLGAQAECDALRERMEALG
ncbi:MAG TPA: tetratricopeptide repeat protein [Gemmatimonadaceae bacterium]|nr:tetratricopeptide repeat protein [Gemmatimonadaceae bacterium]